MKKAKVIHLVDYIARKEIEKRRKADKYLCDYARKLKWPGKEENETQET